MPSCLVLELSLVCTYDMQLFQHSSDSTFMQISLHLEKPKSTEIKLITLLKVNLGTVKGLTKDYLKPTTNVDVFQSVLSYLIRNSSHIIKL